MFCCDEDAREAFEEHCDCRVLEMNLLHFLLSTHTWLAVKKIEVISAHGPRGCKDQK